MLKIFLWGTGAVAKQILRESDCFSQYDVIGFIDNDKNKVNTSFCGREVFFPAIFSDVRSPFASHLLSLVQSP